MARFTNGWIKLHRSLIESDITQNSQCLAIWTWLLLCANYKVSHARFRGEQIAIERGWLLTSYDEIAKALAISKSTVTRHLKYLETTGRIALKPTRKGTLIKVLNYSKYQALDDHNQSEINDRLKQREDTNHTSGESLSKEGKTVRPVELTNIKRRVSAARGNFDFEFLYKQFPKRDGKDMKKSLGMDCCRKLITSRDQYDALGLAVENYARHIDAQRCHNPDTPSCTWEQFVSPDTWMEWIESEPSKKSDYTNGSAECPL